jgi:OOP family OmpA-OmpF porin
LKLSQRRADTVRNALIKKGIPADRVTAKGYGEASPAASNSTKAGRAENRRVELWGAGIDQAAH